MDMRNLKKMTGCGGCAAKLPPGRLREVLNAIPSFSDENLLVGFDSSDDGAVYRLTDEWALIQTLDFFPPITDDPYSFGKIAAANALSDIYAMGGQVKLALNIVCFPEKEDLALLGEILRGGAEKVKEAGGVLCGGHSIYDEGIKYGLSVTGIVHPDRILKNNQCRPGDVIILTKKLGSGIIMGAYNAFKEADAAYQAAIKGMETLNKYAAEVAAEFPLSACTDVTGFGLLGHMNEMAGESHSLLIEARSVPYIPQAYEYAREYILTAGGQRNRKALAPYVDMQINDPALEEILYDPQTSGGLLLALPEALGEALLAALAAKGVEASVVAHVIPRAAANLIIR